MINTRTIKSELIKVYNGYGIFRTEEKKVDSWGLTYGHTYVWYDVCDCDGYGDIIDSFKSLSKAVSFANDLI